MVAGSRCLTAAAFSLLLAAGAVWASRIEPDAVIIFAPGTENVSPADNATLEQIASKAKSGPAKWISLEAYAGDQGSRELNLALSQRRIEAVSHHLAALGIPPNRIRETSYGNEHMDESDLPMRRVEIRVRRLQL